MKTSESSPEPNSNPLTSSAGASLAKTYPKPESELGSPIQTARQLAAVFGLNSPALLGYFDPDGFSLKTSQACLLQEQSEELQEIWPDSGMWDAGSAYELRTSELPTSESASSLWPTTRSSSGGGNTSAYEGAPYRPALAQRAQTWPTARQEDGESCGNHPGVVDRLTGASRNWVTPQSATGGANSKRESRGSGGPDLMEQAQHWLTPHGMANEDFRGKKGGAGGGEFALQANNWNTPHCPRQHDSDMSESTYLGKQASMFPSPASRDYRTPNLKTGSERGMGSKGEQLQNFVEHEMPDWKREEIETVGTHTCGYCETIFEGDMSTLCPTCNMITPGTVTYQPSPPDPQTPDGPQSSESGPTSRRRFPTPSASMATIQDMEQAATAGNSPNRPKYADLEKRRLNPRFVEWLQGFPIGWTEL